MYTYIKNIDSNILVSYNLIGANTRNWRNGWDTQIKHKFDEIKMFVVNPFSMINENFITKFKIHAKKIIPVINKDNLNEIRI